ncbi:MAG TPA: methylenetetrahydrofolate reductase [Candidatus Thermoplasmatota archaeon]|nr:methylenetetrahydrofolate reductase [Candidatus Thermoplasmatota archaeon]
MPDFTPLKHPGALPEERRFRERVRRDAFPITFEALLPKGANVGPRLEEIARLECLPHLAAINTPNNPSARVRVDPAAVGHLILDLGVDVLPHVTCRDDTLPGIQRWLFGAHVLGIRNVVVMTGDHPKEGDYPEEKRVDSVNAIELIAGIKQFLAKGLLIPDVTGATARRYMNRFAPPKPPQSIDPLHFFTGGVLIPWRNQEESYMRAKLEAGADFFQTQITWEAETSLDFIAAAEARGLLTGEVPILVGTSPFKSTRTLDFLKHNIPNVKVPPNVEARLRGARNVAEESVQVCVETGLALRDGARDRGLKTKVGLHVMPMNETRLGDEVVTRIVKELRA